MKRKRKRRARKQKSKLTPAQEFSRFWSKVNDDLYFSKYQYSLNTKTKDMSCMPETKPRTEPILADSGVKYHPVNVAVMSMRTDYMADTRTTSVSIELEGDVDLGVAQIRKLEEAIRNMRVFEGQEPAPKRRHRPSSYIGSGMFLSDRLPEMHYNIPMPPTKPPKIEPPRPWPRPSRRLTHTMESEDNVAEFLRHIFKPRPKPKPFKQRIKPYIERFKAWYAQATCKRHNWDTVPSASWEDRTAHYVCINCGILRDDVPLGERITLSGL